MPLQTFFSDKSTESVIAKNTWMCPNKTKPTEKLKQSEQLKWLLKHNYK